MIKRSLKAIPHGLLRNVGAIRGIISPNRDSYIRRPHSRRCWVRDFRGLEGLRADPQAVDTRPVLFSCDFSYESKTGIWQATCFRNH
jgi:hypothetical protein